MGRPNITEELKTIKNSIDNLSSKVTEYISPTGEHLEMPQSQWGQDNVGTTYLSDREYTNMYVTNQINSLELKLTSQINNVETGLTEKVTNVKDDINKNRTNYGKIFLIV